jgi:ubiquinone biosynthesis protein
VQLTSLLRLPQTVRNLQRVREVVGVVVRFGFGDLLERAGLASAVERGRNLLLFRRQREALVALRSEERIRLALEALGPTFIKLGQVLATRPDLVPLELVRELRKLQDDVAPFSSSEAHRQVEAELGRPLGEVFASFEEAPVAAASIAQVHRATLLGGRRVAVKVRRPDLEAIVRTDLDILQALAALVEENLPELRAFAPRALVDEFARAITREIDLTREATSYLRFAAEFAGDERVHVPRVERALCTEKLLVVEWVDGIKASDVAAIEAAGVDCKALARAGVDFVLRQLFVHGHFHADPHPGNLFVLADGRIAPIDMGQMGTLDRETIDDLLDLLVGMLLCDARRILRLLVRLELVPDEVDEKAVVRDVDDLLARFHSVPIGEVDVSRLMTQLFEALARHHVRVPPELFLMGKALATMEGMARELDPGLDPVAAIRPFALKLWLDRLQDPRFLARDGLRVARAYRDLLVRLPVDLRRIGSDLSRGRLGVRVELAGHSEAARERARSANRVALAAVVAALLVASAWLVTHEAGPEIVLGLRLSALLGLVGFSLAGGGWLLLAWGFLRSGRF